ncbi:MAG TPA: glutamate racemase [Candidatus Bathyarchaeia archaeon]|nr:glutamate racemase [Candidatus Bathyarchaeia archaeon]
MIGVFDSGVGGLTVVKEIKKVLPDAPIIYFGDTARLPYGNKSQETIQKYSAEIVDFLESKGCRMIIVACNTASALAADYLRKKYPELEIYDVVSSGAEAVAETASHPSAKLRRARKVGVIGTTGTINSGIYKKKISELNSDIEVHAQACPLFVPLVEENWINRPETKKIVRVYLRNLKLKKIDTLLLGCTHYPMLEKTIAGVMGKRTKVIASGKKLAEKLTKKKWKNAGGEDKYFVSDLTPHFEKLAKKILGGNIKIKKCTI